MKIEFEVIGSAAAGFVVKKTVTPEDAPAVSNVVYFLGRDRWSLFIERAHRFSTAAEAQASLLLEALAQ